LQNEPRTPPTIQPQPAAELRRLVLEHHDQPILISAYDGTATCGGTTYKAHLLATPH
jgi:hypothetical protein